MSIDYSKKARIDNVAWCVMNHLCPDCGTRGWDGICCKACHHGAHLCCDEYLKESLARGSKQ